MTRICSEIIKLPDIGFTACAQINCAALAQGILSARLISHALQHARSYLSQSET